MDLKNKNIVITGAGSGIGKATALLLSHYGAKLILLDKNARAANSAKKIIDSFGEDCTALKCDISKEEQVKATIKKIIKKHRKIDILINNAGVLDYGKVYEQSPEKWIEVINTNLIGMFLCSRYVIPNMIRKRKGHIVNISSIYGKNASADSSAYCASKFGIRGFSQSMAQEVEKYNIKVSIICPSTTKTKLFKGTPYKPTKNALKPNDVAEAIYNVLTSRATAVIHEIDVVPLHNPYKN